MHALALLLLAATAVLASARHHDAGLVGDRKRELASQLIRTADVHKDRSLRDVLSGRLAPDPPAAPPSAKSSAATAPTRRSAAAQPPVKEEEERPRTLSELFSWAIRATTRNSTTEATRIAPGMRTLTSSDTESVEEFVHLLSDRRPHVRERALLTLEELCHSADNGRDIASHGGLSPVVNALGAQEARVRASAAWALATCAQNNPIVQNKSVELGAVPALARVAARDRSAVARSRALFALNAVLELDEARVAFEREPAAVPAVRRALMRPAATRAVRRALNLAELLVGKNVDVWKTMLEAWDIPPLIERLMREHHDIDVRESAARVIAALDGRVLG